MGDIPKPSDDATWTEVERSFFAAAPPEDLETLVEAPRFDDVPAAAPEQPQRQLIAWLRPWMNAAWRRVTLGAAATARGLAQRAWGRAVVLVGAAGARARQAARTGAAGVVAAFSIWRADRRRLALALVGAIAVTGVAGFRSSTPSRNVTGESEGAVGAPTIAEANPAARTPAEAAPADVRASADTQAPHGGVSSRGSRGHRRAVAASSAAPRPIVTAYMDRQTYWSREGRSAPGRSSRPLFSR